MDRNEPSAEFVQSHHRLGNLVEGFMRRKIKPELHPALEAVRNGEVRCNAPPQTRMQTIKLSESKAIVAIQSDPRSNGSEDDPDDLLEDDIYRDAISERESFQQAMAVFERTTNEKGLRNGNTRKQVHSWEEVLEVVNKASSVYNSNSGAWNKIRIAFHKFGKNNKAFDVWLGLFPSTSDWVSVISGGLKLILGAAARLADLRAEICTALEEIPSLLTCIHRATNIFNKPRELRECSTALYVTTLKLLQHILSWYQTKSFVKITGSLFKQSAYNDKLSGLIKDLKAQSERFEGLARICSYAKITETNELLQAHDLRTQKEHNELFECLNSSFTRFDIFKDQLQSENSTNQRTLQTMDGRIRNIQMITEQFLACHDRMDPNTHRVRGPLLPATKQAVSRRALQNYLRARDQALMILDSDDNPVPEDVSTCLRDVWKLPRDSQDRILATMQSPKLQTWISTNESSVIFINSNARSGERLSSFIPASLIDSVASLEHNHVFTISFFCGMHRRSHDPNSGIANLMKNLIAQLLMSYPEFELQAVRRISQGNLESVDTLCQIFHRLILQLPSEVIVFCLIDDVAIYETSSASCVKKCEAVMNCLTQIVQDTQDHGCVFKLMFTNPQNSRRLYKLVPDQANNVVWIPSRVPRTAGLTPRNMKMPGLFQEIQDTRKFEPI